MSGLARPLIATAIVAALSVTAAVQSSAATPIQSSIETSIDVHTLYPGSLRQVAGGGVELRLIDQQMSFGADEPLRLVYALTGTLGETIELTPPTTTTTVPPTTAPPTTVPPTTVTPTIVEGEPAPETTAAPAPPTTAPPPTEPPPPPPPPIQLSLRIVNYEPLTINDDPERFVGPDVRTEIVSDSIDGVFVIDVRERAVFAEDGSVVLDLAIGTDSGESVAELLEFDGPGLYPIVVDLLAGPLEEPTVVATHGTIVQRLPGPGELQLTSPPVDLALVSAIGEFGPEPSPGQLDRSRTRLDDITAMTAALGSPATLSLPPIVMTDAAGLDRDGTALALADDELVSLPAEPLNVSSATEAGVVDVFARQLREGEDQLTAAVPTTPTRRSVWIATEELSAAGAQEVRDLGYRYIVMTPSLYEETIGEEPPVTDLFVEIALPDGGTIPLLVVDELSEQFTTDATEETLADATPTEWGVTTIAELILDQTTRGRTVARSRILADSDLGPLDPRLLASFEILATTTPNVRFSAAGTLPGVTDTARIDGDDVVVELPTRAGPDLTDRVELLNSTALTMLSAGSMLPEDDPRPELWAVELDSLVSTGDSDSVAAPVLWNSF